MNQATIFPSVLGLPEMPLSIFVHTSEVDGNPETGRAIKKQEEIQ